MVHKYNPDNVARYLHMKTKLRYMPDEEVNEHFLDTMKELKKDYLHFIRLKYEPSTRIRIPRIINELERKL